MDNANNFSLADIAAVLGGNNDGGGFGGLLMIVILFLFVVMFTGNRNGNPGYQPQYATQSDVQQTAQYGNLLDGNRDLANLITNGTAQSVAATNQAKYDNINVAKDIEAMLLSQIGEVKLGQANALANQNACCCETKMLISETGNGLSREIAQSRYDNALALAGMEQRITAKMDANTIQELRDKVDALRDQVNLSGVLRFPSTWSYGAGPFPPIFGGCCGNNV